MDELECPNCKCVLKVKTSLALPKAPVTARAPGTAQNVPQAAPGAQEGQQAPRQAQAGPGRPKGGPGQRPEPYALAKPVTLESKDGPYVITNKIQALLCVYKDQLGFDKADRAWDKTEFKVWGPHAKALLERFNGEYKIARDCLIELAEGFKTKGLDWNLATICRHALNWRQKIYNRGEVGNGSGSGKV